MGWLVEWVERMVLISCDSFSDMIDDDNMSLLLFWLLFWLLGLLLVGLGLFGSLLILLGCGISTIVVLLLNCGGVVIVVPFGPLWSCNVVSISISIFSVCVCILCKRVVSLHLIL